MSNLKYFLANNTKHKAIVYQLGFIGAFLQVKVKKKACVKLYSRYADYFPSYSSYFGRAFILLKFMYVINNSVKLFSGELIDWLVNDSGFKHSQLHMSISYKYAPDGTKNIFYLILMIIYIGIHLKLLLNIFCIL